MKTFKAYKSYITALIPIILWSVTNISAKVLLQELPPLEILLIRFFLGTVFLYLLSPHRISFSTCSEEVYYMLTGLFGVCLFFWLDHLALSYISVASVGILSTVAPISTAVMVMVFFHDEQLDLPFWIGSIIAVTGVSFFYYEGIQHQDRIFGYLLALINNLVWGIYTVLLKKCNQFGKTTLEVTQRVNTYGVIFLVIVWLISGREWRWEPLLHLDIQAHLLFVALGASSLCFVLWGYALMELGAARTSMLSYLGTILTILSPMYVLGERLTGKSIVSGVSIVLGVLISEQGSNAACWLRNRRNHQVQETK